MASRVVLGKGEVLDLITGWLAPGGKVLDVGCGSGRMLRALAERGVSGLGIDPYASEIRRCRRLRAEEMDQLTERFDLVYTRYTLHHIDAPQQFPEKARSVLRPGGVLLIVDWIEGAQTGVPERYFASQTVAQWVRKGGVPIAVRRRTPADHDHCGQTAKDLGNNGKGLCIKMVAVCGSLSSGISGTQTEPKRGFYRRYSLCWI